MVIANRKYDYMMSVCISNEKIYSSSLIRNTTHYTLFVTLHPILDREERVIIEIMEPVSRRAVN